MVFVRVGALFQIRTFLRPSVVFFLGFFFSSSSLLGHGAYEEEPAIAQSSLTADEIKTRANRRIRKSSGPYPESREKKKKKVE